MMLVNPYAYGGAAPVSTIISSNKTFGTGITSLAVPAPADVQDGDLLIGFAFHGDNSRTLTPPSGWTNNRYSRNAYNGIMVASKIASSEGSSHTWTLTSIDTLSVIVVCLRGSSSLSVETGTVARAAFGGTSTPAPGFTSTLTGILFAFSGAESGTLTCTASGMIPLDSYSVSNRNIALFYEEPNPTGATGDRTVTWSAAVTGAPSVLAKAGI